MIISLKLFLIFFQLQMSDVNLINKLLNGAR